MSDATAELWEELRRTGMILKDGPSDFWAYAHDEGVMEDIRTLAAAQGLSVVDSDDGIWLTASPDSRYAMRPADKMRGDPSRETRALVSYASLIILSRLLDPSRISDDLFVTRERIVVLMDVWADSAVSGEDLPDETRELARVWKNKPLSDVTEEGAQDRAKVATKTGIVLYAIKFLVNVGLLEALPDFRWRATLRARALWPYYAGIGAFSQELKVRGIELGVDDYA